MACKDCENSNPITPIYSEAKYVLNPNCANPDCPEVYVPPDYVQARSIELLEGVDIMIENLSDADTDRFRINHDVLIPLTVDLSLVAVISNVVQTLPVLKGKVIDETRTAWSYNKTVVSQTLDEGAGAESVPFADRAKTTLGLSITEDTIFEIEGNTGEGRPESIASDQATVQFGNQQIWGDYTSMLGIASSQVNTMITNLANKQQQVKNTRNNSILATGGTGRHFFVIYPAAWGLATFTKGIFVGGLFRLKNQAGTLVSEITGVETPVSWTNGEGYTEEVYIYQTLYDNTADATEPIIIS